MSDAAYPSPTHTFHVVAETLERAYGGPATEPLPLGNKPEPLDELIYIVLAVMTEFGVDSVYAQIRRAFPSWDDVLAAPEERLIELLRPIGLYAQRARRIRALINEIAMREGSADLTRVRSLSDDKAEAYLATLPGVGKKIARCVMLYSLGREVFPVDTHVLRVLKRLGLADPGLTLQAAQDVLQAEVPNLLRYTLHVNLVVHGRTVCRARRPRCGACVLANRCPSALAPSY
jgi:endonuclease III